MVNNQLKTGTKIKDRHVILVISTRDLPKPSSSSSSISEQCWKESVLSIPFDKGEGGLNTTRPMPLRLEFRLTELGPNIDLSLVQLAVSLSSGPESEDQ
jgi:hypothetical protein